MARRQKNEMMPPVAAQLDSRVQYIDANENSALARKLSWGEIITGFSALYACSVTAFNAGYFSGITGQFSELFTLTDLVGINLRMVEFFFTVLFVYSLITVLVASFFPAARQGLISLNERATLLQHDNVQMYWVAFFALLGLFWIAQGLLVPKISSFFLMMLPMIIFMGFVLNYKWVGYKYKLMPAKALAIEFLICLLVFSYNAGGYWVASEIRSAGGSQAMYMQDGQCLERIILRTTGGGLLLYSAQLKQFEFRNRESVRVIYDRSGCT